ncbi:MAG TPA: polyamine ABC transporter substrate-binding protein [Steroidobacteraceae bacterium]|nr:polyamine ABC transporter substrate-binding protein [Steroidobacteraceae bacterium]
MRSILLLCVCASMIGCGNPDSETRTASAGRTGEKNGDNVLNFYNWADYTAPDTVASFEKLTGVKVRVTYFETNETLEARMLTGNSGFDVVVPTAPFFQRQIRSGAYLPLDKRKLPNIANLDPAIMSRVALNDPGNVHGVVYAWGTYGLGYNEKRVAEALPNIAVDSWRLVFDPEFASKLAACGINFLDAPAGVVRLVLKYLGKNPNAPTARDLADAENVLIKIRPYIRNIDSSIGTEALANGDICVALEYNGTTYQARQRAREAKNGIKVGYAIPKEGSLLWFDMLAIPRDAPHAANAHLFINYLMNPQVIAHVSNYIGSANANSAASPLLDASLLADATVYPTADQLQRLFVQSEDSPEQSRAITRIWQRFKTAQ